jgi:hypothetical protein
LARRDQLRHGKAPNLPGPLTGIYKRDGRICRSEINSHDVSAWHVIAEGIVLELRAGHRRTFG